MWRLGGKKGTGTGAHLGVRFAGGGARLLNALDLEAGIIVHLRHALLRERLYVLKRKRQRRRGAATAGAARRAACCAANASQVRVCSPRGSHVCRLRRGRAKQVRPASLRLSAPQCAVAVV
jgi:hypothetical protein